jgi:hypothetical protein
MALEELRSLSMPELGRTGAAAAKSD